MSKIEIYEMIKNDVQNKDTSHYRDNYSNWIDFLSDSYFFEENIEEIDEVLHDKGEDHWQKLWEESH